MNYLYPFAEYLRPLKLISLMFGLMFLFAGALWSGLPDWDTAVSLIMACPAYITAAPTMRVFIERRWIHLPTAIFWTWFTVDGTYVIYWGLRDPATLDALRHANAAASMALYLACGVVWYYLTPRCCASIQTKH